MNPHSSSQSILEYLEQAEQLKIVGRHEEALELLEMLFVEEPENVTILEEIADNELSMEQLDRAEKAALRALNLDTRSYTAHYIMGFIYSRNKKWDQAIEHLQKANKYKANNAEILRCLGWALFNGNKQPEGVVTLERSLNLDAESTMTLCDLGMAYVQLHNTSKAKGLFIRSLELEPDNDRAKQCLDATEQIEAHLHMLEQKNRTVTDEAKKIGEGEELSVRK